MISNLKKHQDELSRRSLMQSIAGMTLGVSAAMPNAFASADTSAPKSRKKVIRIFMAGGMSHLDSFDPKPKHPELMGDTKVIKTNTGEQISGYFPMLAKRMDKLALIRSIYSSEGDHSRARYLLETSYNLLGTIKHPNFGAWMQVLNGVQNESLPASVHIKSGYSAGFLGSQYDPFQISQVNDPLKGLVMEDPKSEKSIELLKLMADVRTEFHKDYKFRSVDAYRGYYNDSIKLMHSKDLDAFDISKEDKAGRAKYKMQHGDSFLLARRLLEADVQYIALNFGGWDDHNSLWEPGNFPKRAGDLDKAIATFMDDLEEKGLANDVTISINSEMGRSPKLTGTGRGHHGKALCGILAGGGIKTGTVYGSTDDTGHTVADKKITFREFNATLASAVGINLNKEIYSADNRPFTVARGGTPVSELLV